MDRKKKERANATAEVAAAPVMQPRFSLLTALLIREMRKLDTLNGEQGWTLDGGQGLVDSSNDTCVVCNVPHCGCGRPVQYIAPRMGGGYEWACNPWLRCAPLSESELDVLRRGYAERGINP